MNWPLFLSFVDSGSTSTKLHCKSGMAAALRTQEWSACGMKMTISKGIWGVWQQNPASNPKKFIVKVARHADRLAQKLNCNLRIFSLSILCKYCIEGISAKNQKYCLQHWLGTVKVSFGNKYLVGNTF